jgi:signal transduction histidine kinase
VGSRPLDVLAHEVRSPVAALGAIAGAYPAADGVRRARLLELAGAAVTSIERLLIDAVPGSMVREAVDVGAIVRAAVEAAGLAEPSVVADVEEGLVVAGDPGRLRQALDNLIGNALGHSPAGATVTVTARRIRSSVVISVTDEGEGIAPADRERVFDPGVRLTNARPGEGIGLAVVRAIAQAHGGEVDVETSPGQGATFRLALPGASASS